MKYCLPLLLVALVATLLHSAEYVSAREPCPLDNCLNPEKCSDIVPGGACPVQGTECCSIVKSEYRTHCRHFAGECMDTCNSQLQQNAVDCPSNQVCCTLV